MKAGSREGKLELVVPGQGKLVVPGQGKLVVPGQGGSGAGWFRGKGEAGAGGSRAGEVCSLQVCSARTPAPLSPPTTGTACSSHLPHPTQAQHAHHTHDTHHTHHRHSTLTTPTTPTIGPACSPNLPRWCSTHRFTHTQVWPTVSPSHFTMLPRTPAHHTLTMLPRTPSHLTMLPRTPSHLTMLPRTPALTPLTLQKYKHSPALVSAPPTSAKHTPQAQQHASSHQPSVTAAGILFTHPQPTPASLTKQLPHASAYSHRYSPLVHEPLLMPTTTRQPPLQPISTRATTNAYHHQAATATAH